MPTKPTHLIAIGGLLPEKESLPLCEYVLRQSGKRRPAIGFVPTATGDASRSLERFDALFGSLDCRRSHLELFDRTPDLKEFIAAQDVIFVGGGNTKSMLAVWREWGLPQLLKRAWLGGTVLAGWSAGAICWFEQGLTDSFADRLTPLDCLGFLPGSCAPHYDGEPERRPAYQKLIRQKRLRSGIAIEDGAGVHFRGKRAARVICPATTAGAWTVGIQNGKVVERPLQVERIEC